jgi:hypothetical protein
MESVEEVGPAGQAGVADLSGGFRSQLDQCLRDGALRMLVKAVDDEVEAYVRAHEDERDEKGRRTVVRMKESWRGEYIEPTFAAVRLRHR